MHCSVQYGGTLESQSFRFSTADFVYMLLVGIAALLVTQAFLPAACRGPSLPRRPHDGGPCMQAQLHGSHVYQSLRCMPCQAAGDHAHRACVPPVQAVSLAVPVAFPGPSLIFMMVYVWSRNFPSNNISLMGLVRPLVHGSMPICSMLPRVHAPRGCRRIFIRHRCTSSPPATSCRLLPRACSAWQRPGGRALRRDGWSVAGR